MRSNINNREYGMLPLTIKDGAASPLTIRGKYFVTFSCFGGEKTKIP